jgi:hypothetical protein
LTRSVPGAEQMVRVLPEQAIDDGLVDPADAQGDDRDPRARTAEQPAGVAAIRARYLRDAAAAAGPSVSRRSPASSPPRGRGPAAAVACNPSNEGRSGGGPASSAGFVAPVWGGANAQQILVSCNKSARVA